MFIKVRTNIYVQVKDAEQAEEASQALDSGLERNMPPFPHGEIIQVDVEDSTPLTEDEISELGFEE